MTMKSISSIEYDTREAIEAFQLNQLKEQLRYTQRHSPFYRRQAHEGGFTYSEIKTLADFQKLPFTNKDELQQYNDEFVSVAPQQVAEYVTTSGTTGAPVLLTLTAGDLDRLAYNEALSFDYMGLVAGDVVQLTTTLDRRFLAGLAYYLGAQKRQLGTVRVGSGVPELQWDTLFRTRPKALVCVPSFFLKMIEYAEQAGIPYQNSSLQKILCIGEPLRQADFGLNPIGRRIESKWPQMEMYSTYASTEMATAFTECSEGKGGHLHPDLLFAEVLGEDGQVVAEGEVGELVVTPLGVEGMPLIRFQTGDLLAAFYEPCACGRQTMRVGPVVGRKNQMIKYKGTTLYPPAMFDLLHDFTEIKTYLIEMTCNELGEDEITVWVGATEEKDRLLQRIKERFQARLRVSPLLRFDSIEQIERRRLPADARKPYIFIDQRKIKNG
jgi:phenylacetate-CoA ligase